ncbi:hypothetical protein HFP15_08185 [Amycolatopsis sp. K13G38]|uniref:Uncharacterized protein n=1 Tax=Amycolatopsis acididurans TaxID=2724524 RepID=A0ABX1IZA2_9PSEU|nr:hypothetical protein [Amycolatopsis acididurans]NKQ52858.1 hypothetical protein [Amycolatopsis acididurans]
MRAHRRRLPRLLATAILFATAAVAAPAAHADPVLHTLQPGAVREFQQKLDINVVFVGFPAGSAAGQVDLTRFAGQLPSASRSVVRAAEANYGIVQPTHVDFTLAYHPVFAPQAFDDQLFAYLSSIAIAHPLTQYERQYNAQRSRSATITGNAWIDAASAERWLGDHAESMLGIDPSRDTVFLLDWYGRPDFRFHVYTDAAETDPDTGVDAGLLGDRFKLTGWGGTAATDPEEGTGAVRRIWFSDLSAGPENKTGSWNVDDADLNGDGVPDYRIPPVWEYGSTRGYRPFSSLTDDLAKLTRYVATDELFAASPLYDPALSPPALPSTIAVDVNTFRADPAPAPASLMRPDWVRDRLATLEPYNTMTIGTVPQPFSGPGGAAYQCFLSSVRDPSGAGQSCYGNRSPYGTAFEDLYFFYLDHTNQLLTGQPGYHLPVLFYDVPDSLAPVTPAGGILAGFADDDWRSGRQTYVFDANWPAVRDDPERGVGASYGLEHETGHHLGLPHPHDGYDAQSGVDFSPTGPFYFAFAGDEVASPMSYLALDKDFGQFDHDTLDRTLTAAFVNEANAVLARIDAGPRASEVADLVTAADDTATAALEDYQAMNYGSSVSKANSAYRTVLEAAARAGVPVEPEAPRADQNARGRAFPFVDPLAPAA